MQGHFHDSFPKNFTKYNCNVQVFPLNDVKQRMEVQNILP